MGTHIPIQPLQNNSFRKSGMGLGLSSGKKRISIEITFYMIGGHSAQTRKLHGLFNARL